MNQSIVALSPDCFITGQQTGIVRNLIANDFSIVAASFVVLDTEQTHRLYKRNREARGVSRLDALVDQLFLLGPTLVLVVECKSDEDPYKKLRELKGPSDPFSGLTHQLRRKFGATNKIQNLVHSSDSYEESTEEARILLAGQNINRFVRQREVLSFIENQASALYSSPVLGGLELICLIKQRCFSNIEGSTAERLATSTLEELKTLGMSADKVAGFELCSNLHKNQSALIPQLEENQYKALSNWLLQISKRALGHTDQEVRSNISKIEAIIGTISKWERLTIKCEALCQSS